MSQITANDFLTVADFIDSTADFIFGSDRAEITEADARERAKDLMTAAGISAPNDDHFAGMSFLFTLMTSVLEYNAQRVAAELAPTEDVAN